MPRQIWRRSDVVRDYFSQRNKYKEINLMLNNQHNIQMSVRALKMHICAYGLKRRKLGFDVDLVRQKVEPQNSTRLCNHVLESRMV
jgi:hypothetical protein